MAEELCSAEPAQPALHDYNTGRYLRPATDDEWQESIEAAIDDGGAGVIEVDGVDCYVVDVGGSDS